MLVARANSGLGRVSEVEAVAGVPVRAETVLMPQMMLAGLERLEQAMVATATSLLRVPMGDRRVAVAVAAERTVRTIQAATVARD